MRTEPSSQAIYLKNLYVKTVPNSCEFRELAKTYVFTITASFPKGHALIERHIQTIMKTFIKRQETKEDSYHTLFSLR